MMLVVDGNSDVCRVRGDGHTAETSDINGSIVDMDKRHQACAEQVLHVRD